MNEDKKSISMGERIRRLAPNESIILGPTHNYAKAMREAHSYALRAGFKVQTDKLVCVYDPGAGIPEAMHAVLVTRVEMKR